MLFNSKTILSLAVAVTLIVASVANAQLSVDVKSATLTQTITPTIVTQLTTEDGIPLGASYTVIGEPETTQGLPAKVLMIKTERAIDDLLVKFRSKTLDVNGIEKIEAGVYQVSEPGTHVIEVNVLGQNPLFWDDVELKITNGKPEPDPIKPSKLQVVVVVETQELAKMPPAQKAIIHSPVVRQYLNSKCVVEQDGKSPAFRFFDQDVEFPERCEGEWCKVMARPRDSVPWCVIANESGDMFEGPLPDSVESFLTLLKTYGGE